MPNLQAELDALRTAWSGRADPAVVAMVAADIEALRASGILDRAARPGDRMPGLTLPGADGKPVDLGDLATRGPLVLTFYRGGWCPYCNIELRAFQEQLGAFKAIGATLVAVSPERPDDSLDTVEKNGLAFPVLSDVNGRLADGLGIRFHLVREIVNLHRRFGIDLPTRNGDGAWALPIPATYVVAQDGTILAAFVDPDYRRRIAPETALRVLDSLRRNAT